VPDDRDDSDNDAPKTQGKAESAPEAHVSGTARSEGGARAGAGKSQNVNSQGGPGGSGPGVGSGKGAGHEGGGDKQTDFGWYYAMLHDRFYARWDQPIALLQGGQGFATTILIRIEASGHIGSVSLAKSSGNNIMDDSVVTAAQGVSHVDPPPSGLGAGPIDLKIEFKLSP